MALRGAEGTTTLTATSLVTTAETVVATLGPIDVPADSTRVLVFAQGTITCGASVTALAARIRRGTATSDTLVGAIATTVATASVLNSAGIWVLDTLVAAGTVTYSLTLLQTAATGNGTMVQASIFLLFV